MTDNLHTIFSASGCPTHEQLRSYLDGSLPEEETYRVEAHLTDCEMCSDELEGLSMLSDPDRLPIIEEELENRITAKKVHIRSLNPGRWVAAAAVIILFIGALFIFRTVIRHQQEPVLTAQKSTDKELVEEEIPLSPQETLVAPLLESRSEKIQQTPEHPESRVEVAISATDDPITSSSAGITEEEIGEIEEPSPVISTTPDSQPSPEINGAGTVTEIGGVEKESYVQDKSDAGGVSSSLESKKSGAKMFRNQKPDAMRLAMTRFQEHEFEAAALQFQDIIDREPENFKAIYHLAFCYLEMGKEKKAKKLVEKLLEEPGHDYYDQAVELNQKIKRIEPNRPE